MATITVEVDCDRQFWCTIDQTDVPIHNGRGSVHNVPPGDHAFIWAILGSPGDTFSAVLKNGAAAVCEVDKWTIPDDDNGWTGDYAPFKF